jgi:hypothetical protein
MVHLPNLTLGPSGAGGCGHGSRSTRGRCDARNDAVASSARPNGDRSLARCPTLNDCQPGSGGATRALGSDHRAVGRPHYAAAVADKSVKAFSAGTIRPSRGADRRPVQRPVQRRNRGELETLELVLIQPVSASPGRA